MRSGLDFIDQIGLEKLEFNGTERGELLWQKMNVHALIILIGKGEPAYFKLVSQVLLIRNVSLEQLQKEVIGGDHPAFRNRIFQLTQFGLLRSLRIISAIPSV